MRGASGCQISLFANFSSSALAMTNCCQLFIRTIMPQLSLEYSGRSFFRRLAGSISFFSRILGCSPLLCRPRWRNNLFAHGPMHGAPARAFMKQLLRLASSAAQPCPCYVSLFVFFRVGEGLFRLVIRCLF